MSNQFTHLDAAGNPNMVDVGEKKVSRRMAKARSIVVLDDVIMDKLEKEEIHTKKGLSFKPPYWLASSPVWFSHARNSEPTLSLSQPRSQ